MGTGGLRAEESEVAVTSLLETLRALTAWRRPLRLVLLKDAFMEMQGPGREWFMDSAIEILTENLPAGVTVDVRG